KPHTVVNSNDFDELFNCMWFYHSMTKDYFANIPAIFSRILPLLLLSLPLLKNSPARSAKLSVVFPFSCVVCSEDPPPRIPLNIPPNPPVEVFTEPPPIIDPIISPIPPPEEFADFCWPR